MERVFGPAVCIRMSEEFAEIDGIDFSQVAERDARAEAETTNANEDVTMARPVRKQFHASRRSTVKRAFERIFALPGSVSRK